MDSNSDEQFLIVKATVEANRKYTDEKQMNTDEKLTKVTEDPKFLTATITSMIDQTKFFKFSPAQKDESNPQYPTTVVPDNTRDPPLDGGHSSKIGGMWNLKHDISPPKLYELIINTELKGDTDLYPKNFYNHINMCLNVVTRLQ